MVHFAFWAPDTVGFLQSHHKALVCAVPFVRPFFLASPSSLDITSWKMPSLTCWTMSGPSTRHCYSSVPFHYSTRHKSNYSYFCDSGIHVLPRDGWDEFVFSHCVPLVPTITCNYHSKFSINVTGGISDRGRRPRLGKEHELQKPQSLPTAYTPVVEALGVGCSLGLSGLSAGFWSWTFNQGCSQDLWWFPVLRSTHHHWWGHLWHDADQGGHCQCESKEEGLAKKGTVNNCEQFEILLYLQANKLAL